MATSVCTWALLLICCALLDNVYSNPANTNQYQAHIHHPSSSFYLEKWNFPKSNRITAHYKVTYNTTKCCPIILFRRLTGFYKDYPSKYYSMYCAEGNRQEVALYTPFYVYAKPDFPRSGCEFKGDKTICTGQRSLTASEALHWALVAFYECRPINSNNAPNLDFKFEINITYSRNFTYTCETMDISYCRERFGYKFITFPNAFGHTSQQEANRLLALLLRAGPLLECYQHVFHLACHALFPVCQNGKRIFPCYRMCDDLIAGCSHFLEVVDQSIECGSLVSLEANVCIYAAVKCPVLKAPDFGSVFTEGLYLFNTSRYQCNDGYQLQGDAVRQCEPSGRWNSTDPICQPQFPTDPPPTLLLSQTAVIISTVIPVVALVLLAMLCVYFREEMKILILHNRYYDFGPRGNEQKKLFIAYSSEDRDEVSEHFVPQLREQLRINWLVQTYQDDFIAGRNIFDCIREGVWESQAVLVLLTENFIHSHWCLHEFIEAETRTALDQSFKLIYSGYLFT